MISALPVSALTCLLLLGGVDGAAPPIARVEIRAEAPELREAEIAELVTLRPGDPWSLAEIRRTVRNLQASGVADQIEVYREVGEAGVTVIVVLRPPPVIAEVELRGELGARRSLVERELLVEPGSHLVESRVLRTVYALQDFYLERGYREAQVHLEVLPLEEDRYRVAFEIDAGPRYRIGRLELAELPLRLEGRTRRKVLESREGEPIRRSLLAGDAERLQSWLIEERYRTARVGDPQETVRAEAERVDVVLPVEPGPRFEVEIVGARRKELEKNDLLPFLGETGYDEALVLQAVSRIERYYQAKGHHRVAVSWSESRDEDEVRIRIEVDPGPTYSIAALEITGNEEIPESALLPLLSTGPRRLVIPGSGRLVDEVLAADLRNLRSYYRLQGFGRVKVGPARISEEERELRVEVPVVEGARQRVVTLSLVGVEALDEDELLAGLPLQEGGPYHRRLLEDTSERIRARYLEQGFVDVHLEHVLDWNESRTLVDVTLRIEEGSRHLVDRVVVRGNRSTRGEVIRRTVGLDTGSPVSQEALLTAQRRLYRLGIFSRVETELVGEPEDPSMRDVLVRVEEGLPRRLTYGFGYNSDEGVGGLLGWSHSNLFGRAHSFSFDARVTTSSNRRFRLLYRQPSQGAYLLPLEYMLFRFDEDRPGYQVRSFGGQLAATWQHGYLRWGGRFDYRIVEPFNIKVPISEIDRELRESYIASVTAFLQHDRRDDLVDPSRGSTSRLEVELAEPILSATAEFVKLFGEQVVYLDLGVWGVVAASARLGVIEPLGVLENEELPSASIPIVERFFAGGRTTHRAYDRDLLGIEGDTLLDGEPAGGNGILLFNVDYRFPVAGPVAGLVFYDAGNLWSDWRKIRLGELKSGVGLGVRYLSPIGPLRLEVGWKLDREPGEPATAIFLSFGDPF